MAMHRINLPAPQKASATAGRHVKTSTHQHFNTSTLQPITMKRTTHIFFLLSLVLSLYGFQLIKTQLNITVRNDLGNTVEGATVRLFENEVDYNKEENVAAEGSTDEKGVVKFKDLKDIAYFVLVEKDDLNNFGGGEQTGKLEAKRINKVTIVIQ
jgi:hypothetical protein